VESVGASHGLVRLLEGEGNQAKLVIHAAVGFQETYLQRNHSISADESWPKTILQKDHHIVRFEEEKRRARTPPHGGKRGAGIIALPLREKDGTLGIFGPWLQIVSEI